MKSKSPKKIAITAGANGIGKSITERMCSDGHKVVLCDIDSEQFSHFTQAVCIQADVAVEADVKHFIQCAVSELGGLDVLVNNAGVAGPTAGVENVSFDDWKSTLAVNLDGTFLTTKYAVPVLRAAAGGSIVNIASSSALFGTPLRSPYSAAKWGIIGLTKTWAMELGKDNIRVNAICPGCVAGPRIDAVIEREAQARGIDPEVVRHAFEQQTSMQTFVTADEIAGMVAYLISADARHVSGQTIALDGHTESLSQVSL